MPNDHSRRKNEVDERYSEVLWGPEFSQFTAIASAVVAFFDGGMLASAVAEGELRKLGSFGVEAADWLSARHGMTTYGDAIRIRHWESPFGRKLYLNRSFRLYVAVSKVPRAIEEPSDALGRHVEWSHSPGNCIRSHTEMPEGHFLESESGRFKAVMQGDGNFVLYDAGHGAYWNTETHGRGNAPFKCVMQSDGNFVVYQGNGQPTWASNKDDVGAAPFNLVMQDDGNLVTYDSTGRPTWATDTVRTGALGRHVEWSHSPGNCIRSHTEIPEGHFLESESGRFKAVMQGDGSFVLYDAEHGAYWNTATSGRGNAPFRCVMQSDGNFVVYQGNGQPTWASNNDGVGAAPFNLVMQDDGNLVTYDSTGRPTWATDTVRA